MLKYHNWNKGLTSEQDTTYRQAPMEPEQIESLVVNMKNPGTPGVYSGTIYLDGKSCNRDTTPWNCYFQGAGSFTITMTVVGNPTATPTTPPPTATPPPPTATPTPNSGSGSQPSPTASPTQIPPTTPPTAAPTLGSNSGDSNTATGGTNDATTVPSIRTANTTSSSTQAKPPTCSVKTPATPKLVRVTPLTQTSVLLDWTKVEHAAHYAITFGTKSAAYIYGVPNTGDVSSFVITQLTPNTNYYFVVQAVADCAPSPISNEVVARTTIDLPDSTVINLVEVDAQTGIEKTLPPEEMMLEEVVEEQVPQPNPLLTPIIGGTSVVLIALGSVVLAIKKSLVTIPTTWKSFVSQMKIQLFSKRK